MKSRQNPGVEILIYELEFTLFAFHIGDQDRAHQLLQNCLYTLQMIAKSGGDKSITEIQSKLPELLEEISEAEKAQDLKGTADLIEFELIPLLEGKERKCTKVVGRASIQRRVGFSP